MAEINLILEKLLDTDQGWPSARAFVKREFALATAALLASQGARRRLHPAFVPYFARLFDAVALQLAVRVTDANSADKRSDELESLRDAFLAHCQILYSALPADDDISAEELLEETRIQLTVRLLLRKASLYDYDLQLTGYRIGSSSDGTTEDNTLTRGVQADLALGTTAADVSVDGRDLSRVVAQMRAEALARGEQGGSSIAEQTGATGLSDGSSARAGAVPTEQAAIDDRPSSPQYPNRATWLNQRLTERQWTKHTVQGHEGPEHRTVQKVLDGQSVGDLVLNRLATALSQSKKHPPVAVVDIPQD